MNLPSLPTDNLYKFMALAGLAAFFFSVVYPTWQTRELKVKQLEQDAERAVLQIEHAHLVAELYDASGKVKPDAQPDGLATKRRFRDLEIKAAQLEGKKQVLIRLAAEANLFSLAFWYGIVAGLIVTIWGFALWYRRVQKPQDALLQQQLKDAMQARASSETAPTSTTS
jgi:hypothetical protein